MRWAGFYAGLWLMGCEGKLGREAEADGERTTGAVSRLGELGFNLKTARKKRQARKEERGRPADNMDRAKNENRTEG